MTLERARACLHTTLPGLTPAQLESAGTDGISHHARRILERSVREAVQRGDGYLGVEHLLLALLADSRNGAVQTLEELKTTPSRVKRQLELDWPASAPAVPPEEQPTVLHADLAQTPGLDLVDESAHRVLARDERRGLDPGDRLAHVARRGPRTTRPPTPA